MQKITYVVCLSKILKKNDISEKKNIEFRTKSCSVILLTNRQTTSSVERGYRGLKIEENICFAERCNTLSACSKTHLPRAKKSSRNGACRYKNELTSELLVLLWPGNAWKCPKGLFLSLWQSFNKPLFWKATLWRWSSKSLLESYSRPLEPLRYRIKRFRLPCYPLLKKSIPSVPSLTFSPPH